MKEKTVKVKQRKPKKSLKERISSLFFAIISSVCAIALFIGLLFLDNYFSEDITYKEVVVCKKDIPEGEIITETNIETYLGVQNVNVLTVNNGALTKENVNDLLNKKTKINLYKGEIVTLKDFKDLNIYTDDIVNPIEVSIAVDSMAASDGGKIRSGDLVNITLMFTGAQLSEKQTDNNTSLILTPTITLDEMETETTDVTDVTNETIEEEVEEVIVDDTHTITKRSIYNYDTYSQYILENIYVSKVLAADGTVIEPTDTESTAAIFVFIIPKDMELELNNALENCSSMRVSKILYPYTPTAKEE